MSAPTVKYHCPCGNADNVRTPPPPHLPSSAYSFHDLHELFFCEECDAVRCNRCVSVEVSGYYCPNCLFEVPSASVRAEKNRCARSCFMCPNCLNTLQLVSSDPPDPGDGRLSIPVGTVGESPFFLYCNHCRWDSTDVNITFEKATGLAAQLQKFEDAAPDTLEFDRLKEYFEPVLRASGATSSAVPSSAANSHHLHSTSITAAASAALARDIPGVSKYNPLGRSTRGKDKSSKKDDVPEYKTRLDVSTAYAAGGEQDVEFMRHLEEDRDVATLEQRWGASWASPVQASELRPLRVPLHSKRSKRCPQCTHILIKPEQKAQTVRYKIKLLAVNYLPNISLSLPHRQTAPPTDRRSLTKSTTGEDDDEANKAMQAGLTYPFHIAIKNPMYDPIQIRLSPQRMHVPQVTSDKEKGRRPPFAISLPTTSFQVAAFADEWGYDDEEDDELDYLDDDDIGHRPKKEREKPKAKTVGVLEKKGNVTVIGGEVVLGKEARGNVKFNMLVKYQYKLPEDQGDSPSKKPVVKDFEFYTVVDLGPVVAKEERRIDDF
ncbi:dynactin p62 [Cylindrobasidium torrendii FP15055 ss-10]|uniref:Dynactin subunit 4 n=1 Tax=Cylindrobasidium torrendii FP15055 ss-10 TaxID=1314674 RepID=A0A0D7AYQ7_9AGAR|nr:dynactin p62 [Cylindrobasidium torrendii FP15055 ss-10]